MGARTRLPNGFDNSPFLVREAMAAGAGATRLRGRDLDASIWGTRAAVDDTSLLSRCRRFALRLPPDVFFSHTTAARLWGMPLPPSATRDARLDISVAAGSRAPHAAGIRGHALAVGTTQVERLSDIRLTNPARTWCDLASILDLHDLVAAGDFVIQRRLPIARRQELAAIARSFAGRRGATMIRTCLPLLSDRSESAPESVLRVILQLAGLPTAQVNHVLVDSVTGREMRTDLAFPEFMVVIEYQGDYHRTQRQWRADMTRRSRLEAVGWYVMEVNADDLRNPTELVERVLRVLRRRGY